MPAPGAEDASDTGRAQDQAKLYEIIRDELIADIERGKYPEGALLPSIRDMSVKWTVSTTTARRVLAELVNAEYARAEGTRGHVAVRPIAKEAAQPISVSSDAPMPIPLARTAQLITRDGVISSQEIRIDVRTEPAPPEVAMALNLRDRALPVLVRRRLSIDSSGSPIQFRTSYLNPSIGDALTPLSTMEVIEGPWYEALAAHTGRTIKITESYICARHPSDTEAAMLMLTPSACVLARVDQASDERGRPIDYTVTIWPGDSTRMINQG